jgi:hypothetical protein
MVLEFWDEVGKMTRLQCWKDQLIDEVKSDDTGYHDGDGI